MKAPLKIYQLHPCYFLNVQFPDLQLMCEMNCCSYLLLHMCQMYLLKIIWMLVGPGCQKYPPATFVQEVAESAAMPRWPPAKIGPSSVWMIYRLQVTWLGQTRPLMKRSTATRWGLSFPTPASKVVKFNYQDLRHSCIDELHDNLTTFLNDWI